MRLRCKLVVLTLLLVTSCDRDQSQQDDVTGQFTSDSQAMTALGQLSTAAGRPANTQAMSPISFPEDLQPHGDAHTESLGLQAFLVNDDGRQLGLQFRLDRLSLARTPGSDDSAASASAWEYSDVMRSVQIVELTGQTAQTITQSVQRRALGLADSEPRALFVAATRLSVELGEQGNGGDIGDTGTARGGSCTATFRLSAVLPEQLVPHLALTGGKSESRRLEPGMDPGLDLSLDLSLDLAMRLDTCPDALELGDLRQWLARALPVTAQLGGDARRDGRTSEAAGAGSGAWQGHAWLTNSWGVLPAMGGAVVIDTAELMLETEHGDGRSGGTLSISRSKRRSGRGPVTVQATLAEPEQASRALDVQWADTVTGEVTSAAGLLPDAFLVSNADQSIRLQLTPLVEPMLFNDISGPRWSGAVAVSGTHRGVGFVNYQPVDDARVEARGADE